MLTRQYKITVNIKQKLAFNCSRLQQPILASHPVSPCLKNINVKEVKRSFSLDGNVRLPHELDFDNHALSFLRRGCFAVDQHGQVLQISAQLQSRKRS